MLTTEEIDRNIKTKILDGRKTPHSVSQPVLHKGDDGRFYLAVFVFFYGREDIQKGMISRPTLWALANIDDGEIVHKYETSEKDFSDASYDAKYDVHAHGRKYDTSRKYYSDAFAILDSVREGMLSEHKLHMAEYREYLDRILANIPDDYKRFYTDLSI